MDNAKVTITLNDNFSKNFQRISNDLIGLPKTIDKVSSAIDKLIKKNEAAANSFTKMKNSITKSFSDINRRSLSDTTSRIKHLTDHMKNLNREAQQTAVAIKKVSAAKPSVGSVSSDSSEKNKPSKLIQEALKKASKRTLSAVSWTGNKGLDAAKFVYSKSLSGLKLASQTEQENIAFEALLKSPDKAKSFNRDLVQFTNDTPFELSEIRTASKQLLASKMAPEETLQTMKSIGNAATGLGLGGKGFLDIIGAVSRMQTDGSITEKEMQSLVAAGIPAWELLAKKLNTTTEQIKTMTKAGTLPASKVMKDLIKNMNDLSPNAMKQQGNTLAGLYSVIKNTFNYSLLERWGEGISQAIQPRLSQLVTWISNNSATINNWGQMIQNTAATAVNYLSTVFEGGFNFIQTHYLNNPFFNSLPVTAKLRLVISDLLTSFNAWLDSEGGQQITQVTETLVSLAVNGLDAAAAPLFIIALKLGKSLSLGILEGIKETIGDHPAIVSLLGAVLGLKTGMMFGPRGAAIGAIAGWFSGGLLSMLAKQSVDVENQKKLLDDPTSLSHLVVSDQSFIGPPIPPRLKALMSSNKEADFSEFLRNQMDNPINGTLDTVPYSGSQLNVPAVLGSDNQPISWRDSEDKKYPIQFTFHYHGERMGESDVDNMLGIFVRKMEALNG